MDVDGAYLVSLLQIIGIDLVLAGDNAVVIALAARNLPPHLQRRAVVFGALAAVILRIVLTSAVLTLLQVPFLKLVGGLLLVYIGFKLAREEDDAEEGVVPAENMRAAIITILMADVVMSLDNVLAVAAAAHGSYSLIVLGLVVSIPIVMGGATLLLGVIKKYPLFVWLGAALIIYTGVELMLADERFHAWLGYDNHWLDRGIAVLVAVVLVAGEWIHNRRSEQKSSLMVESVPTDD